MSAQPVAGVLATALLAGCSTTATSEVSPGTVDKADAPPGWICTATYCQVPRQERVARPADKTVSWTMTRFRCRKYPVVVEPALDAESVPD